MIHHFLVLNTSGLPRLTKHFVPLTLPAQQRLLRTVFKLVSERSDDLCCFVSDDALGSNTKLVYRSFATLYFIALCDDAESELGLLDLIQVFVESLDKVFENVCELDIIFHSPKVHAILDEIVVGGTVLETDGMKVIEHIKEYEKAEKQSELAAKESTRKGGSSIGVASIGGSGGSMFGGGRPSFG